MARVAWFREAREDLRAAGDPVAATEIIDLAERELDPSPKPSSLEGSVPGDPDVKWRRCVAKSDRDSFESFDPDDSDEFRVSSHDYVLMYRRLTPDELINNKLRAQLIVLRVLSNIQLAALIGERKPLDLSSTATLPAGLYSLRPGPTAGGSPGY